MTKEEYKNYINVEILRCSDKSVLSREINLMRRIMLNPSCCAIYYIRKMQYYAGRSGKLSKFLAQRYHIKLVKEFGICIGLKAEIGIGVHLPHPTSIVIGNQSVIGKNCSIYQNSTIGGARVGDVLVGNQPTIGNNVTIFAGSMVLGHITVADNVVIAANSVLLGDAKEKGVYAGNPARLMRSTE